MAEERRRRRRGRRRGGGDGHPSDRPTEERPEEGQTEGAEEGEPEATEEGGSPSRRRFFFGRRPNREEEAEKKAEGSHGEREERQAAGTPADTSPLSFWRRGRARTFREQPMPKQTLGRTLRRVRDMRFPPWAPVMLIILAVFGILGALFFVRSTSAGPLNGDHWHAPYQILICGQRQRDIPSFESAAGSPGTHGDGIMHQHPFTPSGEGQGSNLANFFKEGGGKLTESEMQIPGTPKDEVYNNGDLCDDGREAELQVFVTFADSDAEEKQDDFTRYVARDGDNVRIVFGPVDVEPTKLDDRTIIAEDQATRTVDLDISGGEADVAFSPPSIDLTTGETAKLAVTNTGSLSHGFRVAGPDGDYETSDDFVSDPEIIPPGGEAVVVVRFDEEGEFEFRDSTIQQATGTIVVRAQEEEEEEEVEETEAPEEVDVTFDV
ncbi:MAG: cupredoxin domain-containing protein, partial [Dehalococcoidia bacterium]